MSECCPAIGKRDSSSFNMIHIYFMCLIPIGGSLCYCIVLSNICSSCPKTEEKKAGFRPAFIDLVLSLFSPRQGYSNQEHTCYSQRSFLLTNDPEQSKSRREGTETLANTIDTETNMFRHSNNTPSTGTYKNSILATIRSAYNE